LPNTARHHVYKDLLIGNDFAGCFNEFRLHKCDQLSPAADED
jgi:hypothetical protein